MAEKTESQYILHDMESAPEKSRELLQEIIKKLGFIPNISRALAESPVALEAYIRLNETFLGSSTFTLMEKQLVLLATSKENSCEYCVAAHSFNASHVGLSEDQISAIRSGEALNNKKLNALVKLTSDIVTKRGIPDHASVANFFNEGYTKEQLLELITAVATKTLANYSNHFMQTELDVVFEDRVWVNAKADD